MIQLLLLYSGFLLNQLSVKKAGVMRHIYTKKILYMQGIYSPASLFIQQMIIAAVVIWVLWEIINLIVKKKSQHDPQGALSIKRKFYILQLIISAVLCIAAIAAMKSPAFIAMMSYTYIIMSFQIALIFQVLTVIYLKYHYAQN